MLTLAGVSASARPFVISGIALAMPPLPVEVPTPAPVRRNHVSSVNVDAPSADALPIVTYWVDPFSWIAEPAPADGVATASFEAAEALPPGVSTATTT